MQGHLGDLTLKEMSMARIKLLIVTPKTKDRERAVLPTILFTSMKEDWGDVRGFGFGIMIGWWAWGIGFSYAKATGVKL